MTQILSVEVPLLGQRLGHFINGQHVPPSAGTYFATCNPATGEALADVARGGARDVDEAVKSAHRAFMDLSWAGLVNHERGRLLYRLAERLRASVEELARLETLDNGKPLNQSKADVAGAARYFEYYAGVADKIDGRQIPQDAAHIAFTVHEPYGVTGHILPWNSPVAVAARSVAPALAAGNSVVIKPAEETPLSALWLAEKAIEVGFPPGVLNVVTGFGAEAGQSLSAHPLVRKISFTGSVETGRQVVRTSAENIVPVGLELGGKSANVIFEDADLDAVVASVVRTVTKSAGQVCSAATRLLVEASTADMLAQKIVSTLSKLSIGPGLTDPDIGPLVSSTQLDRVLGYIDDGRQAGAAVALGGSRVQDDGLRDGFFVQPTLFTNVDPKMRIAREEIFGPVVCLITFESEEEAVQVANGTEYGLAAGVYTRDLSRALRMAKALEAGQVFVNEFGAGGVDTPFGGYKHSGWGREKGLEALEHYTQLKTVIIRI